MNQNIFHTSIEVYNTLNNIVNNKFRNNNSLIGNIKRTNSCKEYKIKGGCYCK